MAATARIRVIHLCAIGNVVVVVVQVVRLLMMIDDDIGRAHRSIILV